MLIDGGGSFRSSFDPGERIVALFLWSQRIMHVDYIAVSHPDRDHFGGLTFIARNFSPSQFWTSGVDSPGESYDELIDAIRKAGSQESVCNSELSMLTIGGVRLRCVGPLAGRDELKENNSSMIIRLDYGRESIPFPGVLEVKGERALIDAGANLNATVPKVPHHGSRTSSSEPFLRAISPRAAVISLGYLNRFGFPADEVVQRYRDGGVTVLRTDQDGAISADVGIDSITLRTFRKGAVILH